MFTAFVENLFSGDKKRRDVISAVTHNPSIDIYISASQKGAISVWNSKVRTTKRISILVFTRIHVHRCV